MPATPWRPPMRPPFFRLSSVSSAPHTCVRPARSRACATTSSCVAAVGSQTSTRRNDGAEAQRGRAAVDHRDGDEIGDRASSELRRLHRGRQRSAQGDGDHAAGAVGGQLPVGLLELAGGRRRRLGQCRRCGALRPELGDGEIVTVDVLVTVDADRQRDDLDAELVGDGLGEVAGRVGDDADAIGAHGTASNQAG